MYHQKIVTTREEEGVPYQEEESPAKQLKDRVHSARYPRA